MRFIWRVRVWAGNHGIRLVKYGILRIPPGFDTTRDFRDAANHTFDVAGSLFGEGSLEQNAIFNAWREAGIDAEKPDLVANVRPRIIMR